MQSQYTDAAPAQHQAQSRFITTYKQSKYEVAFFRTVGLLQLDLLQYKYYCLIFGVYIKLITSLVADISLRLRRRDISTTNEVINLIYTPQIKQ